MKKLFILFIFLILVGCTNTSSVYNRKTIIKLNITTDVEPTITPSFGVGKYDKSSKVYTLELPSISQVDISLSHEGYDTVTVTFSTSELLTDKLEKNVIFDKTQKAICIIDVFTTADADNITIDGYDFTKKGKIFTVNIDTRLEPQTLKITAPGYQTITIDISPEDLIIGYYKKKIIMPKEDEIILSYKFIKDIHVSIFDIYTNKSYDYLFIENGYCFYRLNKGTEIYYQDNLYGTTYLKLDETTEISPFGYINNDVYIVNSIPNDLNNYYFEFNGNRHQIMFYSSNNMIRTNVPIGSQIVHYNDGLISYKKHIDTTEKLSLDLNDFDTPKPYTFKLKLFDKINNKDVSQISDNENTYTLINGYFEVNVINFLPIDYILESNNMILQTQDESGEWITKMNAVPKAKGVIYHFTDSNDNTILFDGNDYIILDLLSEHYSSALLYQYNNIVKLDTGRYFDVSYTNYLPNMKLISQDDDWYYIIEEPIQLDTEHYPFYVKIDLAYPSNSGFIVYVNEPTGYDHQGNNSYFKVKENDVIYINVNYYGDKNPITYSSQVVITKELLDIGFVLRNTQGFSKDYTMFELTAEENIEIINVYSSYTILYLDKGDKTNVIYMDIPHEFYVDYKINDSIMVKKFIFDENISIYHID